jgi:hypothetical protein
MTEREVLLHIVDAQTRQAVELTRVAEDVAAIRAALVLGARPLSRVVYVAAAVAAIVAALTSACLAP